VRTVLSALSRWFAENVVPYGGPGLFLLALVDSGGLPLPESVDIFLFAQTLHYPHRALLYAALATTGSLLGCLFLYWVSRKAGEAALTRRSSQEQIARLRRQYEKYEAFTLVLPAMVPLPLPMKLSVIAAGVFKVRLERFLIAILFGRVVRYFGIALVARYYGEAAWAFIRQNALAVGLGVAVLLGGFYWFTRRVR
jgi:membrane protein YqaA with SNARE-associated domain